MKVKVWKDAVNLPRLIKTVKISNLNESLNESDNFEEIENDL